MVKWLTCKRKLVSSRHPGRRPSANLPLFVPQPATHSLFAHHLEMPSFVNGGSVHVSQTAKASRCHSERHSCRTASEGCPAEQSSAVDEGRKVVDVLHSDHPPLTRAGVDPLTHLWRVLSPFKGGWKDSRCLILVNYSLTGRLGA